MAPCSCGCGRASADEPGSKRLSKGADVRNWPTAAHSKVSTLRQLSGVKRKYGFVIPTAGDGAANWQLEYTTAPRHRPALDLT
jgi:hypothetical protein